MAKISWLDHVVHESSEQAGSVWKLGKQKRIKQKPSKKKIDEGKIRVEIHGKEMPRSVNHK